MVNLRRASGDSGFSLVECMIAVVILSVVATGMRTGDHGQLRSVQHGFEQTVALRALQSRLAEVRDAEFAPTPGDSSVALPRACDKLREATAWQQVKQIEPRLFEVSVTVAWTPIGTQRRTTRTLVTRIVSEGER